MVLAGIVAGVLALVEPPLLASRAAAPAATRACVPVASTTDAAPTLGRRALLSTAAAAALLPGAAFAESTLVTRQGAYTRYVPRIERGRDFWAGGLRKMIANSDWKSIQVALEPVGKKDKGGTIKKFFGPMSLWASSFSSKVISDKTIAMNAAIDELEEAVASLEIAAYGEQKDTGFFGAFGGKKKLDDKSRMALAQAAYKKGVLAFNKYIEIGNDGLGLSFAPIDTID